MTPAPQSSQRISTCISSISLRRDWSCQYSILYSLYCVKFREFRSIHEIIFNTLELVYTGSVNVWRMVWKNPPAMRKIRPTIYTCMCYSYGSYSRVDAGRHTGCLSLCLPPADGGHGGEAGCGGMYICQVWRGQHPLFLHTMPAGPQRPWREPGNGTAVRVWEG